MVKRKQRQAKAVDELKEADMQYTLNYFGNRCAYCNVSLTKKEGYGNSINWDHYHSLSAQDEDDEYQILEGLTLQNAVPSCRDCNLAKSDTNPEVWIRSYCPNADEVIERITNFFVQNKESQFL